MLLLIPAGLTSGSVSLGLRQIIGAFGAEGTLEHFIVVETRLPAILTAALAGAGLSLAGLLMQTCFDNPLAGPSIMGISSGASLGVALVMLAGVGFAGVWGTMAVIAGALAGAAVILAILLLFSGTVRSSEVLLIVGVLIGYLVSSIISLLNFFAPDHAVHGFVMWGMGNFSSVTLAQMPIFGGLCLALCLASAFYVKSLNALLFGADYARTLGVSVNAARSAMLAIAGGLTAVITAWCGPSRSSDLPCRISRACFCTHQTIAYSSRGYSSWVPLQVCSARFSPYSPPPGMPESCPSTPSHP